MSFRTYTQAEIRACWTAEISKKLLRAVELAEVRRDNNQKVQASACRSMAIDMLREIGDMLREMGFNPLAPEQARLRAKASSAETVRILDQIRRDHDDGV